MSTNIHFIDVLKRCKQSSKEAVENLEGFSEFKKYMHVQRPVEKELEHHINDANQSNQAQLILVCGGVGDGKSHILSFLKDKYAFLTDSDRFYLHNDATESFSPRKTSIETLAEVLKPFSDEEIGKEQKMNIVLAINLGALNNFIDADEGKKFTRLKDYVHAKKIMDSVLIEEESVDDHIFKYVNFSDYHMYELTENGPKSSYIKGILQKITQKSDYNPFYQAYLREKNDYSEITQKNPIIQNYELLQHDDIQEKIIDLLIQSMVKEKLIISTRALLDFIYNILVPSSMDNVEHEKLMELIEDQDFQSYTACLLPFQLFDREDASTIHQAINHINPTQYRTEMLDQHLIDFKSRKDGAYLFSQYIDVNRAPYFAKSLVPNSPWKSEDKKNNLFKNDLIKLFVYLYYLIPREPHNSFEDQVYNQYMNYLFHWNRKSWSKLSKLYREDVRDAIYKWNGEGHGGLIYVQIGQPQTHYYALRKLEIEPALERVDPRQEETLMKFLPMLTIAFRPKGGEPVEIDIDFSLYSLLIRIKNGYRPNKKDKFQFIKFVEFIDQLSSKGNDKNELIFESKKFGKSQRYRLTYDDLFNQYSFTEM
ncbi:DNA phosphorothioation-dependent restriction protein DptF [Paenibacillus sp. ACRRY]|uniref:DNA phosphorothioation-dependent restriction protein DptF n=1 Tax=Paenibacillus sp. ACRRY TaxID=2918208 RepID=UPI001EF5961E|nr:DNA phosphorothioation-dependent restriction protein DptF [Paenibacillus sp. ACRRY]MCG7384380.1 DNA phosphorothioation-dependent restriction protein DptF [Paenibacillus sp. ACRRY]